MQPLTTSTEEGGGATATALFGSMSHQLSLFANDSALPIAGWRGMTPPEMADAAPDGYHLDLDGDEPVYEADEPTECGPDRDEGDAEADVRFSPREWAPYCADTIALQGTIRKPASRLGAPWVCTGSTGRAAGSGERTAHVYCVVPLADYVSRTPTCRCPIASTTPSRRTTRSAGATRACS